MVLPQESRYSVDELDAERRHFDDVVASFRDYANWMGAEIDRREQHAAKLPGRHTALL